MKLSAPPPPPPEPGPEPIPTPPVGGVGAEPSVSSDKAPAKAATWPAWFGTADLALVVLTLALAFLVASFAARNSDVWLLDATRTTRFTFDASLDRFPVWSPDGNRIVFDSNRKGHRDLYLKPSNGSGNEELLLGSAQVTR